MFVVVAVLVAVLTFKRSSKAVRLNKRAMRWVLVLKHKVFFGFF
jgi:hypothetical protein